MSEASGGAVSACWPRLVASARASSALAAQGRPVAGDQVSEAQPLQGVDDHHDCAGLPGPGERQAVEALLGRVVAELEGGVAQVAEHVEVLDRITGRQGEVQCGHGSGPVAVGGAGHRDEHVLEAHGARRVVGGDLDVDVAGLQGGAAVGAVGAHDGGEDGHLQGLGRVDLVDGVCGLDEDPVSRRSPSRG